MLQCYESVPAFATGLPQLSFLQDDIRANIEQLGKLEQEIETARDLIRHCEHCPNRPNRTDCPVDKNVDLSDIARLIWDPDCS